eukprot:Pgem_evm1s7903
MASYMYTEALKISSRFKSYTNQVHKLKAFHANDVSSLLLMPVQRPPRYKMLLQELLSSMDKKTDRDYLAMESVFQDMAQCVTAINEQIRALEAIVEILDTLETTQETPLLLHPDRVVLKKAILKKSCKRGKKKPRMVYLFNDMIMYARYSYRSDKWQYADYRGLDVALLLVDENQEEFKEWSTLLNSTIQTAKKKKEGKKNSRI